MNHIEKLVEILNSVDHFYGNRDYDYTAIENDNEEVIGIKHLGKDIDFIYEICECLSEIGEFAKRLLKYQLALREISNEIELDRKFPELED